MDFFKEMSSDDVNSLTGNDWDRILSEDGVSAFSDWSKDVFSKRNEATQIFLDCVTLPVINDHANGMVLLHAVLLNSKVYRSGRFSELVGIFSDNNCLLAVELMLLKIKHSNELPSSIQRKLHLQEYRLSNSIHKRVSDNQEVMKLIVAGGSDDWSPLYWQFIESIIHSKAYSAANPANKDQKKEILSDLSIWFNSGIKFKSISLSDNRKNKDFRKLDVNVDHPSFLLLKAFSFGDKEVIDWIWSWYSLDAKKDWIQKLSSRSTNKHDLVNALYTSCDSLMWLSEKLGYDVPRYLTKQLSHKLFTQYKKWISTSRKSYCNHSSSIFASLEDPSHMSSAVNDMRRKYYTSSIEHVFKMNDDIKGSMSNYEYLLDMVKCHFAPRANLLLSLFDTPSKSQLGLYMITDNHDCMQKVINSLTLSKEEKMQWLNRGLLEKNDDTIKLMFTEGVAVSELSMSNHMLFLEYKRFDDKSLGEFWQRLDNEKNVDADKIMSFINKHIPLHNHLSDIPSKYLADALSCVHSNNL